ncbi:MAG TPA: RecQ family ATP-dependent DNA helicase [Ignavibacteriaceae bacterium]|nr:RecQ family ATP-dependent DNA helicase [Ignavibacteriaceae bacterium]
MTPLEALEKYFGYTSFRPGQEEIINAIIDGENTIAILPTGAGKSICYQIPALVNNSFSIVVSPLIALMKDQVDALNKRENIATFINSTMRYFEAEEVLRDISFGKSKLLYIAPERLENLSFAEKIKNLKPHYLFIDEAHCISEWGHNFRPSYLKIKEFIEYTGIKKVSCFTATSTPEVTQDIIKQLKLKDPKIFLRGFERDNLHLSAIITKKKKEKTLELISRYKTPAIIYTSSRNKAEEISSYLNMHNIKCTYYHAGMAALMRKKVQEGFLNDDYPVIAATNAFGMGIDKKDIRLIIHYNTPGSIENYYQEVGRAGRDGKTSYAYLLHEENDIQIQNFFIKNSHPDKELVLNIYDALCNYGKVAIGNYSDKEISINNDYISSFAQRNVTKGMLHSALKILEYGGYLKQLSEFERKTTIRILFDKQHLKNFIKNTSNHRMAELLIYLVRRYSADIFLGKVPVAISQMVEELGFSAEEIIELLSILDNLSILEFNQSLGKENIVLTSPRIEANRLNINFQKLNESYLNQQRKADSMVEFVYTDDCRFKFILNYFGERNPLYRCGKCDNCCSDEDKIPDNTYNYIKEVLLKTIYLCEDGATESIIVNIAAGKSKSDLYKSFETYGSCGNYDKDDLTFILKDLHAKNFLERKNKNTKKLLLSEYGLKFLRENNLLPERKTSFNFNQHLVLFNKLKEQRDTIGKKFLQNPEIVCPVDVLKEIVVKQPDSKEKILAITGFNVRMYNKVGESFLEIINKNISDKEDESKLTKKEKTQLPKTIIETYELLKKGYNLKEIAEIRKLTESVISMQIVDILHYEAVDISNILNKNQLVMVKEEVESGITDLKLLKENLGEKISYPLLRIALEYLSLNKN